MSNNPVTFSEVTVPEQTPRAPAPGAEPPPHPSIPRFFQWARLDAPELQQRAALAQAMTNADPEGLWGPLLFCGPSGCGKTSIACALLRQWEALNPDRRGLFMPAWQLGVARAQHPLGKGEAPDVARAISAALLVLDDLGTEGNTLTNAVPDVIYARHDAGLPTWVTTSMRASVLTQRYGERIIRRISEKGRVGIIQWQGFVWAPDDFLSANRL